MAEAQGARSIAYTYNEPFIWYEYVFDTARLAREKGLANVLVTNGYVNREPLEEILPWIDAVNLDIKSIEQGFYSRLCGGDVGPVLETARRMVSSIHLEITNLVIPGQNDSPVDLEKLAAWVAAELGRNVPVHLSAYFPRYKLKAPPTSGETLNAAAEIFSRHCTYVYQGNVVVPTPTICHSCGAALVERMGYSVTVGGLNENGKCAACGADNNFKV